MIPVKVEQLVAAVGGKLLTGSGNRLIKDVIIDSREKAEDSLFASGAKTLFMQKESAYKEEILSLAKDAGACVVAVEDTVSALQNFAAWYRNQFELPVVGITGSVGKTTTKEMISAALETEKKVLKTIGNKNSQIGLPLMMFYLDDSYDIAIIEMGMSEVGEMKNLTAVARPECAVMTNIGVAHIAQLGSKENIRKEKLNIINEFDKRSVLFVNGNDTLLNNIATEITQKSITMDCDEASRAVLKDTKALTYGISTAEEFDISAVDLVTGGSGIGFTAVINAEGTIQKVPVQLKVYGNHNVMNALAAIAVAMHYGISPEKAAEGLAEYEPIAMRGQIKTVNGITWIDDTYNASPDSMKSGAQVMLSLEGKRHIAVFADVLELGEASEQLHREVGAYLAKLTEQGRTTDILVTVGTQAAFIADEAKKQGIKQAVSFASNAEATEFLKQTLTAGDVVLVKGSRGMHTEEIVKAFI